MLDALTSQRPYKPAWTMDEACRELTRQAGTLLDPDCVVALVRRRAAIEAIGVQFPESVYG